MMIRFVGGCADGAWMQFDDRPPDVFCVPKKSLPASVEFGVVVKPSFADFEDEYRLTRLADPHTGSAWVEYVCSQAAGGK